MKRPSTLNVLCLLLLATAFVIPAAAQDAPNPPPAAAPARYVLTLPPGFVLVEGPRGKVICEPADREWVLQTLSAASAATRPTTMPSDLLARWEAVKEQVIAKMAADYAIDDTAQLTRLVEESLTPELRKLQEFAPPLFFLATTESRLKELLKTEQWASRDFTYNRLADELAYRSSLSLTLERPMDDTVAAAFFGPNDDPAARSTKLAKSLDSTRREVEQAISGRAMFVAHTAMIEPIVQSVFKPMELPRDQRWLEVGLAGATSADYAELVVGSPRRELLLLLSAELRNNPIKMRTINLLAPADPESLKRQYAAAYADAYRRKCAAAALRLLEKNRPALPELMRSLRKTPCKTGQELLQRITQITGVDLSDAVAAK